MSDHTLTLIRGVSGAGKTKYANNLFGTLTFSADDYFEKDGDYLFDAKDLKAAHQNCRDNVEATMQRNNWDIAVANTFTTEWEMKPYFDLAEEYGYTIFTIIVENRHGNKDVHNVPAKTLERQRARFDIKL